MCSIISKLSQCDVIMYVTCEGGVGIMRTSSDQWTVSDQPNYCSPRFAVDSGMHTTGDQLILRVY
jgi:hypothetical protein